MEDSRFQLPTLTSPQSLLFLDHSVAIFLSLILSAGLCRPSSSRLLIRHLATGHYSPSHRENLLPWASKEEGSAVSERGTFQKGQSTGPPGLMAMNYGCHVPIGLSAEEPQRVSLPFHPQAPLLSAVSVCCSFSWRFCIRFTRNPFYSDVAFCGGCC